MHGLQRLSRANERPRNPRVSPYGRRILNFDTTCRRHRRIQIHVSYRGCKSGCHLLGVEERRRKRKKKQAASSSSNRNRKLGCRAQNCNSFFNAKFGDVYHKKRSLYHVQSCNLFFPSFLIIEYFLIVGMCVFKITFSIVEKIFMTLNFY